MSGRVSPGEASPSSPGTPAGRCPTRACRASDPHDAAAPMLPVVQASWGSPLPAPARKTPSPRISMICEAMVGALVVLSPVAGSPAAGAKKMVPRHSWWIHCLLGSRRSQQERQDRTRGTEERRTTKRWRCRSSRFRLFTGSLSSSVSPLLLFDQVSLTPQWTERFHLRRRGTKKNHPFCRSASRSSAVRQLMVSLCEWVKPIERS